MNYLYIRLLLLQQPDDFFQVAVIVTCTATEQYQVVSLVQVAFEAINPNLWIGNLNDWFVRCTPGSAHELIELVFAVPQILPSLPVTLAILGGQGVLSPLWTV